MRPKHPKNPRKPRAPLTIEPEHVMTYEGPLWRIHTTSGMHPSAWNEMRKIGPISRFRWDPHPPPTRMHLDAAVSYTAPGYTTAFAEVFQDDKAIVLSPGQALSGWETARELTLLDLVESDWAIHQGASASLPQATKDICRNWSNAIWKELSESSGLPVDGLYVPSTKLGDPMVVLFPRASNAFPPAPAFSRALNHADVATMAANAANRLRWHIR
jgi:hypothetical protein